MIKQNSFAQWWFTLLVVPAILFVFGFLNNKADGVIFGWLSIFLIAMAIQMYTHIKYEVEFKSLHFLYIVLCMNFMMFIGYLLSRYSGIQDLLEDYMPDIIAQLLWAIISGLISSVIKMAIWFALLSRWKSIADMEKDNFTYVNEILLLQGENRKIKKILSKYEKIDYSYNEYIAKQEMDNRKAIAAAASAMDVVVEDEVIGEDDTNNIDLMEDEPKVIKLDDIESSEEVEEIKEEVKKTKPKKKAIKKTKNSRQKPIQ